MKNKTDKLTIYIETSIFAVVTMLIALGYYFLLNKFLTGSFVAHSRTIDFVDLVILVLLATISFVAYRYAPIGRNRRRMLIAFGLLTAVMLVVIFINRSTVINPTGWMIVLFIPLYIVLFGIYLLMIRTYAEVVDTYIKIMSKNN